MLFYLMVPVFCFLFFFMLKTKKGWCCLYYELCFVCQSVCWFAYIFFGIKVSLIVWSVLFWLWFFVTFFLLFCATLMHTKMLFICMFCCCYFCCCYCFCCCWLLFIISVFFTASRHIDFSLFLFVSFTKWVTIILYAMKFVTLTTVLKKFFFL